LVAASSRYVSRFWFYFFELQEKEWQVRHSFLIAAYCCAQKLIFILKLPNYQITQLHNPV
jgi:hypothetical protein